jgi:hypothetical protein
MHVARDGIPVTDRLWEIGDVVLLLEEFEALEAAA